MNTAGGNSAAVGSAFVTTPPGSGAGSRSLAVNVDASALAVGQVTVSVDFCPGGAQATGIQGAFHVSVWFKPSDSNGAPSGPGYAYLTNGNTVVNGGSDFNTPAGMWFELATAFAQGASVSHVDVTVGGLEGHKGVLYFDNAHFD